MKITIFGATGGVGALAVSQALAAGHEVTAVVRDPAQVPGRAKGFVADLSTVDPAELEPAVDGADGVLCAFGPRSKADVGIASRGIGAVIDAMRATGAQRLVAISAAPVATVASPGRPNPPKRDPGDGFLIGRVLTPLIKKILAANYADLALSEDRIRTSGLDWTIVRPPRLTDKPGGEYRTSLEHNLRGGMSVPRADVATAMLEALSQPKTVGRTLRIAS